MPRTARPWFRTQRAMWYGLVAGKQHPLSQPTAKTPESEAAAWEVFRALLSGLPPQGVQTVAAPRGVREAVVDFLKHRKPRISPGCWRQYDITLRVHFLPAFGARRLNTLTADEIEDWANRPAWSSTTRHNNLGTVQTFMRWAKHPLPVKRPATESRGADTALTDEQFAAVIAAAVRGDYPGDLRELLRALRETGARPQEIALLTVDAVDWGNALVRLRRHKTARHGRDRVIHLNSAALATLTAQRDKYQTGTLFRTRAGNPFKPAQIVKRCRVISGRVGFRVIAYGLGRHSFATKALAAGVPDAVVAELLGHRGTGMLHAHYSHLGQRAGVLKEAAEKVAG